MKSPMTIVLLLASCIGAHATDLPSPLEDRDFLWNGTPSLKLYELGRSLFFDPILSGNQNVACATCHDPARGTGDGVSLSIGQGGSGFGPERVTRDGVIGRVPCNAQPLYNIGARAYTSMFHDERLELDHMGGLPSRLRSPAKEQLPEGLHNALIAQAVFPVFSAVEMAGQPGENPVSDAVSVRNFKQAWSLLADRLAANPGYALQFVTAFDDTEVPDDIRFDHAAKAIAAFETMAFRSDKSWFNVTGDEVDQFTFRTPSLRNVALTGPWGHNGAFSSLEDMVRHHLDAVASLANYAPADLLPLDSVIQPVRSRTGVSYQTLSPMQRDAYDLLDTWVHSSKPLRGRIARANTLAPMDLSDEEVESIVAFLETLTNPTAVDRSHLVPVSVPSGLPPQPGRNDACLTDNFSWAGEMPFSGKVEGLPEPRCDGRGDESPR